MELNNWHYYISHCDFNSGATLFYIILHGALSYTTRKLIKRRRTMSYEIVIYDV